MTFSNTAPNTAIPVAQSKSESTVYCAYQKNKWRSVIQSNSTLHRLGCLYDLCVSVLSISCLLLVVYLSGRI